MSASTLDFSCNAGDCWGSSVGTFDNTGSDVWLLDSGGVDTRTWIPFTVNVSKGTVILSATLKLIASTTSGVASDTVTFGCEAADNPSNPSSKADLFTRAFTAATNNYSVGQYISGTTYTYDITNAVQEILNRSGWANGNVMAILTKWAGSGPHPKKFVSNEGGANKAVLEILVNSFVPRSSGMI
jgi:hypothetical protein